MIHETAVISPDARIGENVSVGPYSVINGPVSIGDNSVIGPHVNICGHTEIGRDCKIHKSANIGDTPQDISYTGFTAHTKIGNGTVIREYVTIHRGSKPDAATVVGDDCMLMAFSHLGHDCILGDKVIIANNTQLAGHVEVGDKAILSGNIVIHQFCRIGTMAMLSATAKIGQDVPPFCLVNHMSFVNSLNVIGMKRNGICSADRVAVKNIFKYVFYGDKVRSQAVDQMLEEHKGNETAELFLNFIKRSKRGIQHLLPRD